MLVGLGLCAVVVALRQNADFNEEFAQNCARWITNFILVCGVALGMGLVAKESSRGTLSFLLGKPLSAVEVLLPKYVVGAVALLVLAAGAWVTVYVDLEGLVSRRYMFYSFGGAWNFPLKQFAEEVGYVNMLLVHLTTGLVAYSLIFTSSTVADHPLKGAALGILLLIVLDALSDSVLPYFPALEPPLAFLSDRVAIVRMVSDPWLYFVRLSATAVVMAACAAVSIALWRRFRGVSLGWKPVVIGWLGLIACINLVDLTREPSPPKPGPLSVLTPEEGAYLDLAVVGDRGYVATEGGLAVVDLRDPTKPELLGFRGGSTVVNAPSRGRGFAGLPPRPAQGLAGRQPRHRRLQHWRSGRSDLQRVPDNRRRYRGILGLGSLRRGIDPQRELGRQVGNSVVCVRCGRAASTGWRTGRRGATRRL